MRSPLVSILIPFKNTEAYLNECLKSIINQTYTHWEVLIIDDHSTDFSSKIVEKFSSIDNRIKLFKNKGQGIIEALRMAFSKSKGALCLQHNPRLAQIRLRASINADWINLPDTSYMDKTGFD